MGETTIPALSQRVLHAKRAWQFLLLPLSDL